MGKPHATLMPLHHRGEKHIKVEIANNAECKDLVRQVKGRKWSKTHNCWYVPYAKEAFQQLKDLFEVKTAEPLAAPVTGEAPPPMAAHQPPPMESPTDANANADYVRLERENDKRMKATVPWHRKDWAEKIRTVPGRAWNGQGRYWSLPLVKTTVNNVREWFGENARWDMKVPDDIPETYLPKNWKAAVTDEKPGQPPKPQLPYKARPAYPPATIPGAPAKLVTLPAASLNKLNIQPSATPRMLVFAHNGVEVTKVVGETLVIAKPGGHFLYAYVPHDKKGWMEDIKAVPGRTWSAEARCWRLPYVVETVKLLYRAFGERAVFNFRPSDPIPFRNCFKTPDETENVRFWTQTQGIFEGIAALLPKKLPKYESKRWRFMAVEGFQNSFLGR